MASQRVNQDYSEDYYAHRFFIALVCTRLKGKNSIFLKYIGVSRGGPVNIDINACKKRNITVANAPGRNSSAAAEFTVGMILSVPLTMTAKIALESSEKTALIAALLSAPERTS